VSFGSVNGTIGCKIYYQPIKLLKKNTARFHILLLDMDAAIFKTWLGNKEVTMLKVDQT